MTKMVEVWKLQSGDTVQIKGDPMVIKNIDVDLNGLSLNLIDSQGRGHYAAYGHDDILSIELN